MSIERAAPGAEEAPGRVARWRAWINRDDGAWVQVDNRALPPLGILGYSALVMAVMLWLLHDKLGLAAGWSMACAVVGVSVMAVHIMSAGEANEDGEAEACPICGGTGEVELVDEEVGCRVQVPCEACRSADPSKKAPV